MSMFKQATKKKQKARVALIGPAGSGKTFTALTLAKHLGARIAVIDTERGSASKYAGDVARFDVCEPESFEPRAYIQALHGAAGEGYDVVVIDSLSHAWEGEGGILDQVDKRGGRFEAWKDMSPQTRQLIDAILTYPGHVVATMRTKTEYVVEQVERKGRMVSEPRKVGLAPKFKEGLEYEFDVVATMDEDNTLRVTKSRAQALNGAIVSRPGKPFADALHAWLEDGEERTQKTAPTQQPSEPAAPPRLASLTTPEALRDWCAQHGAYALGQRGGRERVMQRAAQLEVPAHVAAAWLDGTPEAPSYDPSEQDAPPPDET